MSKKLVVIDIVGLTHSLLGKHTPNLNTLLKKGWSANLQGVFPALTTTAQSSMLTGLPPSKHGIVGNGWYFRDTAEIRFWLQSNHLVEGKKIWETIKEIEPSFKVSKLFWWYNMYSTADFSITPRPHYGADGLKLFGLYSHPQFFYKKLEDKFGAFPLFNFWGPTANINSSKWIVDCAIEEAHLHNPNLQLVYLPHLDYNLQRLGPNDSKIWQDVADIDYEVGRLITNAHNRDAEIMIVSEYGIEEVHSSISINRHLREKGWLKVRKTPLGEMLDAGASEVFSVSDHQIAHIYIKNPNMIENIYNFLQKIEGIEKVLGKDGKKEYKIDHIRSGELIVIAKKGYWFDYHYWLNDKNAPDFARTVDIHRKIGYDPLELFIDPNIKFSKLKIAMRLLQKKMGFRTLMNVIPLETSLIKGSHGRLPSKPENGPILITTIPNKKIETLPMENIYDLIKEYFLVN